MVQTTNKKRGSWIRFAICIGLLIVLVFTGKPDLDAPLWFSLLQAGLAVAFFVCWYFPILKKMFCENDA
jgi:hypothetical protein